jgi:hypothetical protein
MATLPDIHATSIDKSAALSAMQVPNVISPHDVIRVLNEAKVSFVLIGAHGLSGWVAKPRATEDVDVVVMERHLKKATRALVEGFPFLEPQDEPAVVRLRNKVSGEVLIDLIKQRELYRETFKHTRDVTTFGHSYRIPTLEMALSMKFAAMMSPNRAEADRLLDAHDFIHIIQANSDIDRKKLGTLGELVFAGGGAEVLEMVRKVQAGEKLIL